jgi:phosphoenolpyruvate---glycerone phosphotransferase subunit DhaM
MTSPVGIVLVSHSAELARGLVALVRQLGGSSVPVAAAGGTDGDELGTSYDRVRKAIDEVDRGSGVLVLVDLGSAVLTARQVIADAGRADVLIADAPLVEGAVSAAVAASVPGDLAAVRDAAEQAHHAGKL